MKCDKCGYEPMEFWQKFTNVFHTSRTTGYRCPKCCYKIALKKIEGVGSSRKVTKIFKEL